ncbi:MAG: hypothetical protein IJH13_02235 [Bacilli bacterium]|nr:hypothetical protein [Bacilli bacterium]
MEKSDTELLFMQQIQHVVTEFNEKANNYNTRREFQNARDFLNLINIYLTNRTFELYDKRTYLEMDIDKEKEIYMALKSRMNGLLHYFNRNSQVIEYNENNKDPVDYIHLSKVYYYLKTATDIKTNNLKDVLKYYKKLDKKMIKEYYRSTTTSGAFVEEANTLVEANRISNEKRL